ncbi:esterase/lipase family protein [Agromyces atrinae]|uniref:Alpha/beta hydrolase n=1 Tax=Agromyces atrinae TaxID=592376 RepID=A0A4Q2MC70_9MICO|nr:hypothetical protein [Agromyces atrinae]NYD67727.1 hypothetical protein [Agromyces atrinae]RXZ88083.1 hypothetical protein ESP50_02530 [Agromyces atrinae]
MKLAWWALDYVYAVWRQLAGLAHRRPPARWAHGDSGRPTLVLVPGIYENWRFLVPLGDALNAAGYRVTVIHGLGLNLGGVRESGEAISRALDRVRPAAAGRIIVAHSKGGLIGKQVLVDGTRGVVGLVAVCTPFGGARLARLFTDRRVRALLPTDETIVMLGSSTAVNGRIVSVFGTFDPHVPDGSTLDGATNIEVPVAGHFRILGARATHEAVLTGLGVLTRTDVRGDGM